MPDRCAASFPGPGRGHCGVHSATSPDGRADCSSAWDSPCRPAAACSAPGTGGPDTLAAYCSAERSPAAPECVPEPTRTAGPAAEDRSGFAAAPGAGSDTAAAEPDFARGVAGAAAEAAHVAAGQGAAEAKAGEPGYAARGHTRRP